MYMYTLIILWIVSWTWDYFEKFQEVIKEYKKYYDVYFCCLSSSTLNIKVIINKIKFK